MDNMDMVSKAADPGKLQGKTDWFTWSQGYTNYQKMKVTTLLHWRAELLSLVLRMFPLLYVLREFDDPMDAEDKGDYLTAWVCRAPLSGTTYVAAHCQVHQLLSGKVLGEQAEEWIGVIKKNRMVR
jgi:hypothetical protein